MKLLRAHGLALAIVLVSLAAYLPFAPVRLYDFRAFYCAGTAIRAHADPYRLHPLQECERTTAVPAMPENKDGATVPAPLPGYVLAGFALLSLLPFGVAVAVWIAASLAALLASIALLRHVVAVPVPAIAVAVVLPAAIVALPLGQSAPFVVCAIALCAYGLWSGRPRLAAIGALATAADPAVALVLCATLLIVVPATRATILAGTAALAALALLTLGADTNLEYVRTVLHAHAAGNVAERSQFSTTHFAWVAGLASRPALVVGNVWYACSAATGIWVAFRLRRTLGVAAPALIPPAFAVFGGLYVHYSQIVLAVPAYLLMLGRMPEKAPWLSAAIFVLAVPWLALAGFPPFAFALVVLAIAYMREMHDVRSGVRLGLASGALLVVLFAVAALTATPASAPFVPLAGSNPLAEEAWSRYIAWRDVAPNRLFLALELPTIAAFCACLARLVWMGIGGGNALGSPLGCRPTLGRRLNPGAKSPMDSV
jgi:hypothetical protein